MSAQKDPSHLEELSDRELLIRVARKQDQMERHMRHIDLNWTIAMKYMGSLNTHMGRKAEADEIEGILSQHAIDMAQNGNSPDGAG